MIDFKACPYAPNIFKNWFFASARALVKNWSYWIPIQSLLQVVMSYRSSKTDNARIYLSIACALQSNHRVVWDKANKEDTPAGIFGIQGNGPAAFGMTIDGDELSTKMRFGWEHFTTGLIERRFMNIVIALLNFAHRYLFNFGLQTNKKAKPCRKFVLLWRAKDCRCFSHWRMHPRLGHIACKVIWCCQQI